MERRRVDIRIGTLPCAAAFCLMFIGMVDIAIRIRFSGTTEPLDQEMPLGVVGLERRAVDPERVQLPRRRRLAVTDEL
jgi:hypothetical protein